MTTLLIGLSLIWATIGYNLSSLRCQIPKGVMKIAKPMIQVLYSNGEHESVQLTQSDDAMQTVKTSDPTFEKLVIVIDKVVFVVYSIALCLVHI